jgi:hypothetical protein
MMKIQTKKMFIFEIFETLWIDVLPDVSTLYTCRTQPTINIKDKNINNTNYLLTQFGATHLLWGYQSRNESIIIVLVQS